MPTPSNVEEVVEKHVAKLREQLYRDFGSLPARIEALEAELVMRHSPGRELNEDRQAGASTAVACHEEVEGEVGVRRDSVVTTKTSNTNTSNESYDLDTEDFTELSFEESIWSVVVLLGLKEIYLGWFDSLFALMLLLLNIVMQACFSAILLTRAFMGDDFEKKIESAKIWRTSVAHDYKYLDLVDTSLVSRVCHGDESLILSTTQATMIDHVNSFLGLSKYQFEIGNFQPGILLSMLCIILWTLCVYKELRLISVQTCIGLSIRRSKRTHFHKNEFRSISFGRLFVHLHTCLARATIASILLVAGILWLSRTTSIQELMLNAVALNAILDVDEFLFVGMSPIKIQEALRNLKPFRVKYSHQRSQCESGVHFAALITTVLLAYYVLLFPLQQAMVAVKTEMCGGNRTFVVSHNSETQRTIGLVTVSSRDVGRDSISAIAVTAHMNLEPGSLSNFIAFAPDVDTFQERRSRTMREEASAYPFCVESRLLNSSGDMYGDPSRAALAVQLVNNAAASVRLDSATSCMEMQHMCGRLNARLLRLVCGQTCGCTDPLSSPWYKTEAQGCATTCLRIARRALARRECKDIPKTHPGWVALWESYPLVADAYFTEGGQANMSSVVAQTSERMLSGGCAALVQFPSDSLMDVEWCEGMPDLFRPLAHMCPQSCGCRITSGSLPSFCPTSCNLSRL